MTVQFNLGTFEQDKAGYYMLIGQKYSETMDPINNVLPPVSWYYVKNVPGYEFRKFYIANVTKAELDQSRSNKRKRREVSSVKLQGFQH